MLTLIIATVASNKRCDLNRIYTICSILILSLSEVLLIAISKQGYTVPSSILAEVRSLVLEDYDVIVSEQEGFFLV